MNNISEDIKILEEILEPFREQKRKGKKLILNITGIKYEHYESLQNLLNRVKELEKIEQEHKEINGELRERVKELEEENVEWKGKYLIELNRQEYNCIPKSKIKEKIEEIKRI